MIENRHPIERRGQQSANTASALEGATEVLTPDIRADARLHCRLEIGNFRNQIPAIINESMRADRIPVVGVPGKDVFANSPPLGVVDERDGQGAIGGGGRGHGGEAIFRVPCQDAPFAVRCEITARVVRERLRVAREQFVRGIMRAGFNRAIVGDAIPVAAQREVPRTGLTVGTVPSCQLVLLVVAVLAAQNAVDQVRLGCAALVAKVARKAPQKVREKA